MIRALLLGCLLICSVSADTPPTSEQAEGRELAAELRAARPAHSFTNTGILRRRDANGVRSGVPVTIRTVVPEGAAEWFSSYEARLGGTNETLTITHAPDRAPTYEIVRGPAGGPASAPQALAGDATATPFAGSDFWACDLGLDFFHWPEQHLVRRDKPEMRKGRPCRILESVRPAGAGYVRVRSWIDLEHRQPLIAEAYDAQGNLVKEFSVGSVKRVDGVWQLKDLEIVNERDGTVTKLEFDLKVGP
jgi:Outer membrane lipoprotein-sorting protein